VACEFAQHGCSVPLVDDQEMVEELTADGADKAFGDRIIPRRRLRLIMSLRSES